MKKYLSTFALVAGLCLASATPAMAGITWETKGTAKVGGLILNTTTLTATGRDLNATALNANTITMTSTPASGSCAVQFTVKDTASTPLAVASTRGLVGYISDVAGVPVTAATSAATLTNGTIITLVTGKVVLGVTSSVGLLGMTLTANAATYYWTWILPNGKLSISTAIVVN